MLIDAHAHLDRYGDGLESALSEITQHGIFTISNSMDLPSYERNLEIARRCELVLPIFGVHPWNAPEYVDRLKDLSDALEHSPMIGEIGLDHHFVEDPSAYPAQRQVLEFFLTAANEQGKIVNLHTKGAEREILGLLDRYGIRRAIVHWYSGPLDVFGEMVERGVTFTVGVEVLHSDHIRAIARQVPSRQLLTETDNPGGPKSYTGALGTPLLVREVVEALARLRETTAEAVTETVQANLARLVEGDPRLCETHARLSRTSTPADRT